MEGYPGYQSYGSERVIPLLRRNTYEYGNAYRNTVLEPLEEEGVARVRTSPPSYEPYQQWPRSYGSISSFSERNSSSIPSNMDMAETHWNSRGGGEYRTRHGLVTSQVGSDKSWSTVDSSSRVDYASAASYLSGTTSYVSARSRLSSGYHQAASQNSSVLSYRIASSSTSSARRNGMIEDL